MEEKRRVRRGSVDIDLLRKNIREKLLKGSSSIEIVNWMIDTYGYAKHTAETYLCDTRKELKEFFQKDKETFLEEFNAKYEYLYNQLVQNKQYAAAGKILDSQVRITGLLNESASIEVNKDQKVVISFGFNNKDDEE